MRGGLEISVDLVRVRSAMNTEKGGGWVGEPSWEPDKESDHGGRGAESRGVRTEVVRTRRMGGRRLLLAVAAVFAIAGVGRTIAD